MIALAQKYLPYVASLLALCIASAALYSVSHLPQEKANTELRLVQEILVTLDEHERLLNDLQADKFVEKNKGILESYLIKIRRDGVPAHSDMKRKVDALDHNLTALSTLLELYEPNARTPAFKSEAKNFRSYALAWSDRWGAMFDYFMGGGEYSTSQFSFPSKLIAAVKAERAAI